MEFTFDRMFYQYWNSIYRPSILIHILSFIPFWFGSGTRTDETSEKSSSETSNKKCRRSKDKSHKRFILSLTSLVLMTWFVITINPTNSSEGYTPNRKSMWINFLWFMNFVSFLHVCMIGKGTECPSFGKKKNCGKNDNMENVPLKVN